MLVDNNLLKWRSMGRHFFLVSILGFISGLPFSLLGSTLAAWFSSQGISIVSIGFLSLLQQPYVFKFLWAPLLDIKIFSFIDRRRGWIVFCQICLCLGIILLAFSDPTDNLKMIGLLAFCLVFISATQDIAIDAYRAEILAPHERGLGATVAIFSYRIATFVSGALALIVADYYGWELTFILLACLCIPCSFFVYFYRANLDEIPKASKTSFDFNLWTPIKELIATRNGLKIIVFILLFKLGEVFTSTSSVLLIPFMLNGLGFSLSAIGIIGKGVGILATMTGSVVAGFLLFRFSLYRNLYFFALLQIFMNMLFVILAIVGKNYTLLAICVFCENLVAGMGMTALVTFMMGVCNKQYTATQLALFTAISALPRTFAGPIGASIQSQVGWVNLFILSVVLAMPVLIILKNMKSVFRGID